jgi:hypothetical protein
MVDPCVQNHRACSKYTQFRSLHAGSWVHPNYHDVRGTLLTDDHARCLLQKILTTTRTSTLELTGRSLSGEVRRRIHRDLSTTGFAVVDDVRLTEASVRLLRTLREDTLALYTHLFELDGRDIADVVEQADDTHREYKYRDGRIDMIAPSVHKLVLDGFRDIADDYLALDRNEAACRVLDVRANFTGTAHDGLYQRYQDIKTARSTSQPQLLTSGFLDGLPGSDDQEWHADPADVQPYPNSLQFFCALDEVTITNGPTEVKAMNQTELGISNPVLEGGQDVDEFANGRDSVQILLPRGGFVFMDPRLLHRGSGNSSLARRSLWYGVFGTGLYDTTTSSLSLAHQIDEDGYISGTRVLLPDLLLA